MTNPKRTKMVDLKVEDIIDLPWTQQASESLLGFSHHGLHGPKQDSPRLSLWNKSGATGWLWKVTLKYAENPEVVIYMGPDAEEAVDGYNHCRVAG